ncbi:hypothetical protein [Stenotrophomonas sp. JAG2]|uniref:hypothetical protein n=1 Tax=Stenotrophomonas sp. JAG2 TaxID=3229243 RepID=UPI0034E1AA42
MRDRMKRATLYLTRTRWHGLPLGADNAMVQGNRSGADGLDLEGLDVWLATLSRRQSIRVLLSAASVPLACTPWTVSIASATALRRQAAQLWEAQLGSGHGHEIRLHWPRHGMPLVSVAWPPGVRMRVASQLQGRSISVMTSSVFAAVATDPPPPSGRILLLAGEDDGYCALHLQDGEPVGIERLPLQGSGLDAIPVWMRRKRLDYPDPAAIRWIAATDAAARSMCEVLT